MLLCLFSIVFLGCGGGGSISKAEFAQQADKVCVKSNTAAGTKIIAAFEKQPLAESKSHREAIQAEVDFVVPILTEDAEGQLQGIKSLEVPSGDEQRVDEIVSSYEAWLKKAETEPRDVVVKSDVFKGPRNAAGKYGISKCAHSPFEEPYMHN